MALTVFSIPVGVFAENGPIDWENEGTEFYVTDAKDTGFLYVFNGKKQLPDAVVEWGDELLTEGVDYDILPANEESQNSVNAGDYKFDVYVKGKFKPGVVKTIDLTINTKDLRPTVTLTKNSYVYDGKVKTPAVTVKDGSTTLKEGTDYTVTYASGRKNAGSYKVEIELIGNYNAVGDNFKYFKITKAKQTVTVKTAVKTVASKKLKKNAQTVKPITKVTKKGGAITYKIVGGNAKSKKALKCNSKTGKITVKKKTKKGTYQVKVRVTSAASKNYKAAHKDVKVTVKVK